MLTASLTSAVGIAINIATTLIGNPIAWAAVAIATTASGGAAAWISRNQPGTPAVVIEETLDEEVPKLLRSEKRSTLRRVSQGVVKRRTIETRPDGTRLETIEFFSEELAREDTD
jgi:hypothetical protein